MMNRRKLIFSVATISKIAFFSAMVLFTFKMFQISLFSPTHGVAQSYPQDDVENKAYPLESSEHATVFIRICSQKERKLFVRNLCQKLEIESYQQKLRFLVDTKNKIAYHVIAKAGSTTFRTLMLSIAMESKIPVKASTYNGKLLARYGLREMYISPEVAEEKLNRYIKVIVVRNPMARLLSVYKGKFIRHTYYGSPGRKLKLYFQAINQSIEYPTPAFSSFLRLIGENTSAAKTIPKDIHWTSYFISGNPCSIDYDYILKLETMSHDLELLIKETYGDEYLSFQNLQANSAIKGYMNFTQNTHHVNSFEEKNYVKLYEYLDEYWKVSKGVTQNAANVYVYDNLLFGYGYNVTSSLGSCQYTGLNCC